MVSVFYSILEDLMRPISGRFGRALRRIYYSRRFSKCGEGLDIAPGVHIVNPQFVEVGDHVAIDFNSVLLAGKFRKGDNVRSVGIEDDSIAGRIIIGSYSHIGINNIVQGHAGVRLGAYFTSSANCSIYSFSNDPAKCRKGTLEGQRKVSEIFYVAGGVFVGDNVWIGLGVNLVSCSIGDDVFVKAGTLVKGVIGNNVVVGGIPAQVMSERFKS